MLAGANTPGGGRAGRRTLDHWRGLRPVARGLIAAHTWRSVAQGALSVDFVLYLRALHWSVAAIGGLITASILVGAGLGLVSGPASDRLGRRGFILLYEALCALSALGVVLRPGVAEVVLAGLLLGVGRGANGAGGPVVPVEQAWLAQGGTEADRTQTFSLNSALTFWGMGAGALLGAAVPLVARILPGPSAYQPLFALNVGIAVLNYWQIARLREVPPGRAEAVPPPARVAGALRRRENRALGLLVAVNAVNSLGIGIFSPLLPYWFAVRYGAGPAALGPVFALAFLLAGASSLAAGALAGRIGVVASVAWVRIGGVALLAALPLAPSFGWAALLYVARSALNRSSVGARQAFGVGLVGDARRGLASGLNTASQRIPSALGPTIAGWLMGEGALALPFFLAAGLQLTYVVLFTTVLGRFAAPRPLGAGRAAT